MMQQYEAHTFVARDGGLVFFVHDLDVRDGLVYMRRIVRRIMRRILRRIMRRIGLSLLRELGLSM